jgi:hypothetical protein
MQGQGVISMKSRILAALAGFTLLGLAACQSPSVYAPQTSPGSEGYADRQLASNRFRVSFHGNSATSREMVEDYLLRRAAEVTLQAGYSAFLFDHRDTKTHTRYYTDFMGWPGWGGYGGWYWHNWDFDATAETRPITSYIAYAEITTLKDADARHEPRALGAQDVLSHLGPLPPPPK